MGVFSLSIQEEGLFGFTVHTNSAVNHTTYAEITRREKDGTLTNKGKKTVNEFGIRTNIWRYANGKGFSTKDKMAYQHPAIFPEKLAEDHIRSWSNPGDIILDPFLGSGTSLISALNCGRNFIGYEYNEGFRELMQSRFDAELDANADIMFI